MHGPLNVKLIISSLFDIQSVYRPNKDSCWCRQLVL